MSKVFDKQSTDGMSAEYEVTSQVTTITARAEVGKWGIRTRIHLMVETSPGTGEFVEYHDWVLGREGVLNASIGIGMKIRLQLIDVDSSGAEISSWINSSNASGKSSTIIDNEEQQVDNEDFDGLVDGQDFLTFYHLARDN